MGNLSLKSIAKKYDDRFGFRNRIIQSIPSENLGIIVVIPSFKENYLIDSINSINSCFSPKCEVEIIVVINNSEVAEESLKAQHQEAFDQIKILNTKYTVYPILEKELPKKHAGVGLARKIGMDEAARRFAEINKNGIIACFDADAVCDPNYLIELESNLLHQDFVGASIYFEHPTEGADFSRENYTGIINYELFLRYYNLSIKYAGFPYSYHTVGSSMAVKTKAYLLQGGMNRRKAGEDFYFLHKIIQTGSFKEINSTCIRPSARTSDRVPFGTGKAINDWIEEKKSVYLTYDFQVFEDLKTLLPQIEIWYNEGVNYESIPFSLRTFFKQELLEEKIQEIKKNTTSLASFRARFFVWFDAFKLLKLVHWYRDEIKGNKPLLDMVNELVSKFFNGPTFENELEALKRLRKIEQEGL
jgi:hypothetical protein